MTVDAVVSEVYLAAHEPARPHRASRIVEHALIRRRELESEIIDNRIPEPFGVVLRPFDEFEIVVDPMAAHEPRDVCVFDVLAGRSPHELAHLASLQGEASISGSPDGPSGTRDARAREVPRSLFGASRSQFARPSQPARMTSRIGRSRRTGRSTRCRKDHLSRMRC